MPRAARTCSACPAIITTGSKCEDCTKSAAQRSDRARGTTKQRGYTGPGHRGFRRQVLTRDPLCVLCHTAWATIADHHPLSRKQLVAAGLNPNDPDHGRGLCKPCHDRETATNQPGGWNLRSTP